MIEEWTGRTFQRDSRFHQALAVLDDVAATGQFTHDQRGDDSSIRALQLAFDAAAIASALPPHRVADLRRDLEICARGPLVPSEDLQPLQTQSQLVVRAALSAAGVLPSQPTHSGSGGRRKPDILVENGATIYALEVKRPTAAKNVVARALDAATQIAAAGLTGAVVIDITDCLATSSPDDADAAVLQLGEDVQKQFFKDGVGWCSG